MEIITIETPSLGDRSYLVTDGTVAAVIDPQRDLDRVLDIVAQRGLTVTNVFETHIHNDYVTGGYQLAQQTGAAYHVNADDEVAFAHAPIRNGDEIKVGDVVIRAVHTPGHTPTHLSYVASDDQRVVAVFTGGSMLYGSVGRTDLVAADQTETLTRQQYRSARTLAEQLPDDTQVRPTHGFGSFCSSGDTSGQDSSTIAQERRDNQALTIDDEDAFVRQLLAGLDDYPAYYAHMAPANRSGPGPVDLSPVSVIDPAEFARRIAAGEWVIDLRARTAFARDHMIGTINVELADAASTYLGWIMAGCDTWDIPVTLIGESAADVANMQRQLVRIGIDRPAGQRSDGLAGLGEQTDRGAMTVTDFAATAAARAAGKDPWILDVRRNGEWAQGHIPDAHHVPLHRLVERLHEVPADRDIWVHCASGYRAAIAASLLARAGRKPILIDEFFDAAATQHFALVQA